MQRNTLVEPRCFHAAVFDSEHGHLILGGSSHLFQGATVSHTVEQQPSSTHPAMSPRVVATMLHKRAGHVGSLNSLTRQLVVCGGYGGGSVYHDTVEVMDLNDASGMNSGFQQLPPMGTRKTGAGGGFGPDGCMYVCGGSTNGSDGLTVVERLDLRTKQWETLAPLNCGRGYCSGAWNAEGRLYVAGGSVLQPRNVTLGGTTHTVVSQKTWDTIEMYDARKNDGWHVVVDHKLQVERADLCVVARLMTSSVGLTSVMKRENPVVDWWQSRRMRTLST